MEQQYSSFSFLQRCAVLYGSVLELGCGNVSFQLFSENSIWQDIYLSLDTAAGYNVTGYPLIKLRKCVNSPLWTDFILLS